MQVRENREKGDEALPQPVQSSTGMSFQQEDHPSPTQLQGLLQEEEGVALSIEGNH
jgi:hypothetical protein